MAMPRKDNGVTKVCKDCGVEKPLVEYFMNKGYYTPRCKPCHNYWYRVWRSSPNGKITYRKWSLTERGKEVIENRMANWTKKNAKKKHAQTMVSNAIRDNRLMRGFCSTCGEQNAEAHHKDYNKPFDIVWLCKRHHMDAHYPAVMPSVIEK